MFVIEERRIGWRDRQPGRVRVLFEQQTNTATYEGIWSPIPTRENDAPAGWISVVVPADVTPGPCLLFVEHDGIRSVPLKLHITAWEPPEVTSVFDRPVAPGDTLPVYGTGFHANDVFEILDASGHLTRVERPTSTSDTGAPLPETLPLGRAKLRIVCGDAENGLATSWFSFKLVANPPRLVIVEGSVAPAAAGQLIEIVFETMPLSRKGDKVEIEFIQDGTRQNVYCEDLTHIKARIPTNLQPGSAAVVARAWRGDAVGEWSEPVEFRVLDGPPDTERP
jgi:hypothetical protein